MTIFLALRSYYLRMTLFTIHEQNIQNLTVEMFKARLVQNFDSRFFRTIPVK